MRHLLRRLGFYLLAFWASVTLNFFIPRLIPGDPAQAFVARLQGQGTISPATMQAIRAQFGLSDAPLWVQYWEYLGNLLRGELGISLSEFPTPVSKVLEANLSWTLGLIGLTAILSFLLGTAIGMVVAWRRNNWLSTMVTPVLTFFSAIPYFWMALGFLYLFSFILDWFPLGGGYDAMNIQQSFSFEYLMSVLHHAMLPAITILLGSLAGWVLGMRNAMITTLSEDYVLMARAKGLPENQVMVGYAARNAILPNITGFAMSLGFVVGGALLTEMVFSYPGIGFALFNAVTSLDYSLIQGIFLVLTITMLVANFLSEIVYTMLDPRVRQERA